MKLKRILIKFLIVLFLLQLNFYTFCNATEISNEGENIENAVNSANEPPIYSEAAILMEEKTGKILYEKNIHDRKYPASTTKVLTAIIALEKCDLNEKATASYEAVHSLESGYTKADIQVGETFTIEQLLNVLILQSANEAANVIAEHISGSVSEFANLMNEKAKEIGCVDSHFVNPNGMHNENHYSSAYDLALIARYCMKNEKFRKLVTTMECSLPHTEYWTDEQVEEHGERNFKNTNNLLIPTSKYYYQYAIGVKAGFTTPAKNCLISASNKDGFETIAVVLHAETTEDGSSARYLDTINLFEYGYNNYKLEDIYKEYNITDTVSTYSEDNQIVGATNSDNNIEENDNNSEEVDLKIGDKINANVEISKIIIGSILIILILIYFISKKSKKGKHEYSNDLYKFNLNMPR